MGNVVFLSRNRRMGSKGVIGPVTLLDYVISAEGTPVSQYDVEALLEMTEDPCCGKALPFGGQIKSFGVHVPSTAQWESIPAHLWDVEPVVPQAEKKRKRAAQAQVFTRPDPEPVVEEAIEESD